LKHFYIKFRKSLNNKKQTILFLHGWGGDINSFFYFENELKNKYNLLNCDLFGFGYTKLYKKQLSVYDYANELFIFLKNNNINELNIICHSFGFRIAIILSTLYDIKISKLLVFGGAGLKPKFNIFVYLKIKFYKLKKKLFNSKPEVEDLNNNSNLYDTFVKVVNEHLDYLIKDIKSETLLVWGDNDKSVKLNDYKKLLKKINTSKGMILKGDHFVYLKNKIKCYNIINKFLINNH